MISTVIETAESTIVFSAPDSLLDTMIKAQAEHGAITWSVITETYAQGTFTDENDCEARVFVAALIATSSKVLAELSAWTDERP